MSIEKAKEMGAIAFGEKYGSEVQQPGTGDGFDRELCGGTHVPTTGHTAVTALRQGSWPGVCFIRGKPSLATERMSSRAKEHALVSQLSQRSGRADELPERIESLLIKLRESEKELNKIRTEQALRRGVVNPLLPPSAWVVSLVASAVGDAVGRRTATSFLTLVTAWATSGAVVALAGLVGGKPSLVIATNEGAREACYKQARLCAPSVSTWVRRWPRRYHRWRHKASEGIPTAPTRFVRRSRPCEPAQGSHHASSAINRVGVSQTSDGIFDDAGPADARI